MQTDHRSRSESALRRRSVTPEAFRVSAELMGTALAKPSRRALALAVDGALVATVSHGGGLLLAGGAAAAVYVLGGRRLGKGRRSKLAGKGALAVCAVIVFALTVSILNPIWQDANSDTRSREARPSAEGLAIGGAVASIDLCRDTDCREAAVVNFATALRDAGESADDTIESVEGLAQGAVSDDTERERLIDAARAAIGGHPGSPGETEDSGPEPEADAQSVPFGERIRDFSVVAALRTLISDLGLGVGWGALYFTLLPVWWNGRTPGKHLLGIRIVHLSGRPLSYWDAFSRYGGYAAGLATGLLGFLQVYWDDNRQAIHDKIGFTAVIVDGKPTAATATATHDHDQPPLSD